MNLFEFESSVVDSALALLLDVSVKATLLATAVLGILVLSRVRSVTVRHRVWSLVSFCMLLMPAMVSVVPAVTLPAGFISYSSPAVPSKTSIEDRSFENPATTLALNSSPDSAVGQIGPPEVVATSVFDDSAGDMQAGAVDVALPVVPAVNPVELNLTTPVRSSPLLLAVTVIYALGALLLLVRMIIGFIQCKYLVRRSRPVVLPRDLAVPGASAGIVESDDLLVPVTLGLWRPMIILPTDWKTWDKTVLQTALAHEAEHIRRGDTWVAFIATCNTALYWFHPLSWLLRGNITELAEQACDDEVIRTTGQRTTYAQILVEMASRLATGAQRYQPTGIGMAKTAFVELRVSRILDSKRPLSSRLSSLLSAVLFSVIASAAMITAGLSPAAAVAATQEVNATGKAAEPAVTAPTGLTQKTEQQPITGRVVMADDSPVPDAEVRMLTWTENTRYKTTTTRTNEQGEFRFDEFDEGKHRLAAYVCDKNLSSRIERYKGDFAEPGQKTIVLKLQRVPAMKVTARSADTSQPIPGARVRLTWTDIERDYLTDARGQVTIRGLTAETWTIEVQAKGYAEQVHAVNLSGSETVEVTANLESGAELSGIVRNEAGEILPGAGVSVFPSGMRGEQIEYMVTNEKGEYHFEYLPIGSLRLHVSKEDYQRLQKDVVISVAADESHTQDLTLIQRPDGGSIQGTVVDSAGSPVVGAVVGNQGNSSDDVRTTTTDAKGLFRLDHVFRRYDGHQLTVKAKGYAPQQLRFTPGTKEKPETIAITLKPGHSVSGKVVNEKGQPLSGVWIVADVPSGGVLGLNQTTRSDETGKFSFDSLSDEMPFGFRKSGYSPIENKRIPLDGKDDVIVTMLEEGVLRGKVVDDETGEPISPFIVHITHSPDREPADPRGSLSGPRVFGGETFAVPDGTFRMGDLSQGKAVQVSVEAANYERRVVRRMVATSVENSKVVEFRLVRIDNSAFFAVGGQLLNESAKPVPNAELRLIVTSQRRPFPRGDFPFNWEMIKSGQVRDTDIVSQFLSATTDGEGRFEFSQVRPGKDIELLWWGSEISQDRLAGISELQPEQRATLSVQVITAGIVRGAIDPTMFPEVSMVDLVKQPAHRGNFHSHRSLPLAADGGYEIRDVPPGTYELMIYGPFTREKDSGLSNEVIKRVRVSVESGKTVTLNIGPESSEPVVPDKNTEPTTSATPVNPDVDDTKPTKESVASDINPKADVIVTGRVTDGTDTGLAGAKLWLPLTPIDDDCMVTTTDSAGNYSLRIPANAMRPAVLIPTWTIWCYAEGRQIAAASAYPQIKRVSGKPVDFALKPASDTGFVVKTTAGKAVPNARVEPWHFLARSYDIIPEPLRKIVGTTTDENGRALLPAMGRDGFYRVQVEAEGYGTQQLRLKDSAEEPAIRTITLQPTGRLEGRLISDNPEAIRNVKFYVEQDNYRGAHISGIAVVETDREGRFAVPAFSEGEIWLRQGSINHALMLRPRIPSKLQIYAGVTTTVEIPCEATVRVRGRVQTKTDSQPVVGGLVHISYGSFWQSERILTDADGRFEVDVLAGPVRQHLISRPDKFADWTDDLGGWLRPINVPDNVDHFDLPPLQLVQNLKRTGRLLNADNQPLADVSITALAKNRNYGDTTTDAQGIFELQVPESVQIDRYRVTIEKGKTQIDAKVITESPLVLQLTDDR